MNGRAEPGMNGGVECNAWNQPECNLNGTPRLNAMECGFNLNGMERINQTMSEIIHGLEIV